MRVGDMLAGTVPAREITEAIDSSLDAATTSWPPHAQMCIRGVDLSVASARLGPQGEVGILVTGSLRHDFPAQTEKLLLDVAANQATVVLQQALLLRERRRLINESDRESRLIVESFLAIALPRQPARSRS
jgi:hypothetical protein